jgi:hypothetical protein
MFEIEIGGMVTTLSVFGFYAGRTRRILAISLDLNPRRSIFGSIINVFFLPGSLPHPLKHNGIDHCGRVAVG